MKSAYGIIVSYFFSSLTLFAGIYSGGNGTSGNPYQVATLDDLKELCQTSADWGAYFIQTASIDASATQYWDDNDDDINGNLFDDTNDGTATGNNEGFRTIGNSTTNFTGQYDGDNYTISGLTINRSSTNFIGMFGNVGTTGNIFDINLTSVNILGQHHTGALTGENKGSITNCSATGTINSPGEWIGGLVGSNNGGTIEDSHSECTVSATSVTYNATIYPHNVGGFVGVNYNDASIDNCYATGDVSTSGHASYNSTLHTVGGFCGFNSMHHSGGEGGTITNCHAEGDVTAQGFGAGGFIGIAYPYSIISNCYATGNVIADSANAGGFVGFTSTQDTVNQTAAIIRYCYATGSATTNIGSYAGGFVGKNQDNALIEECFATGNASAARSCGAGFAGGNTGTRTTIRNSYSLGNAETGRVNAAGDYGGGFTGWTQGKIEYCYSIGTVTQLGANSYCGGFCASNASATIPSCFYDSDVSGESDTGKGEPETTANMKTQSIFLSAGWNPLIWNMDAGVNNGYPYLDWQNPGGTPLPVELVSFTATLASNRVVLNWRTASEVNNYGFEVERAIKNEELEINNWEKVGFVQGHGNSSSPKSYEFVDTKPTSGKLQYRLKQIDTDGSFAYYETTAEVSNAVTSVDESQLPTEFSLSQNYPNPFNPTTTIKYNIPAVALSPVEGQHVSLKIYNILGNEVAQLVNKHQTPGFYEVEFDGCNLSSGLYIYHIKTKDYMDSKKMLLVK